MHSELLQAWSQTGSRRAFCRGSAASSSPEVTPAVPQVREHVRWPLVLGCLTVAGIAGGGTWLSFESSVSQVLLAPHPSFLRADGSGTSSFGVREIAGLFIAGIVGLLPVDELKVALLRKGALHYWGRVLIACSDQPLPVLVVLHNFFSSDSVMQLFHSETKMYSVLAGSLMALLEPQDMIGPHGRVIGSRMQMPPGFDSNALSSAMSLGAALSTHPSFLKVKGDEHLWEALLLAPSDDDLNHEIELSLAWTAIASSAAQRPSTARFILLDNSIKLRLLHFCSADVTSMPPSVTSKEAVASKLQRDYATVALHRLALVAAADGVPHVALGRGHSSEDYLQLDPPEVPLYSASRLPREDSQANLEATIWCLGSGLLWGALRGLRRNVRAVQPIWTTALMTGAGACTLQAEAEVARAAKKIMDDNESYGTLQGAMAAEIADNAIWFSLLWFMVQSGRTPFAFGGWLLGSARFVFQ